ncbi:GTP 3',8-cyclase MoaA [Paenibacillus macquariensis]|uniref:GTP 3',8-cyclase n=1 Tax=Paenibacillus macquariensis TaxID=948756 RepID=A0ABY1JSU1_9BACL|nr:GTP 3',8-cyclase MoaA [Paenibacillus macquariensis]MEC0092987.1 GTP 3',8-cyclase MoaA [Paenibacillus macquariensis]OAB36346.1 cyclic pyranopterin phosphate synthase [Paenibacillus macquariensis subsp. macquariensis]SIQ70110.1 cyclic pyranopterin phosphate synthase [Paenibacillus macquariensis]
MQTQDQYNRSLRDLRISITDRCNFRCRYCMPEEIFDSKYAFLPKEQMMSVDEIIRLAQLFTALGVQKIRITGGEPLLRKDLPEIIERVSQISQIEDVALTTNGSLLAKHAQLLKNSGLMRVAVSLDALDDHIFMHMNGGRSHVQPVLNGIEAAAEAGLKVKVNMVVQKGMNVESILPMVSYFRDRGHILRLIEYMDVGNTNGWNWNQVVSKKEMLERIHSEWPLEPIEPNYSGEVASRFRFIDGKGEIGIISSVSDAFCSTCTRARLSSEGTLYTCLFATKGYELLPLLRSGVSDEEITSYLVDIWYNRNDRYSIDRGKNIKDGTKIEMSRIGG